MPEGATLQVRGYRQMMQALAQADKRSARAARDEIRKAGDHVKAGAALRFARYDARSAAGYRTRVRQAGVRVEQSLRKTTGKHPEFGALQMRKALVPSLYMNEARTERALEQALDRVCDQFNHGAA